MGFRPEKSLWARCAPTWNDTETGFPGECVVPFRDRVLQGEVSDGNAYAMGGVAGHAGVVRLFLSLSLSFIHYTTYSQTQTVCIRKITVCTSAISSISKPTQRRTES